LDHEVELLDSIVLSVSNPLIQIHTELDEVTHRLLEGVLVVDLDKESQLRVNPIRRDLKPHGKEIFLAAHLDEQLLYFIANKLFLGLNAEEVVLIFVCLLHNAQLETWIFT
jgi:predicted nucleic acid-binding protein